MQKNLSDDSLMDENYQGEIFELPMPQPYFPKPRLSACSYLEHQSEKKNEKIDRKEIKRQALSSFIKVGFQS